MRISKMIIENQSDLPMSEALAMARQVVELGRISNDGKQYCYLTTFKRAQYSVVSSLNKKSDKLVVYNTPIDKSMHQGIFSMDRLNNNKPGQTPRELKGLI